MGKKVKSAYESALERVGFCDTPKSERLTDKQKEKLAEIDRLYAAKVAERKILAENEMTKLAQQGKFEEISTVKDRLVKKLGELEEEKKREKKKVRSQKS